MSVDLAEKELELRPGLMARTPVEGVAVTREALLAAFVEHVPDAAVFVAWSAAAVLWARWDGKELHFPEGQDLPETGLIYELRFFNETRELHLQRVGNAFRGRLVVDGTGKDTKYVDSLARLWGKRKPVAVDGFVPLRDADRKIEMTVPYDGQMPNDGKDHYLGLVTRNYVGTYPGTGQAGYVDYRFVRVTDADWEGGEQDGV